MDHFGNEFTTNFHLIDAAKSGKSMIRVLSEDTEVFVLQIWWVYREDMECKWQMERCNIQCWTTVSVVAWHVRPQQLRHDLLSIHQSQDQSARHRAH